MGGSIEIPSVVDGGGSAGGQRFEPKRLHSLRPPLFFQRDNVLLSEKPCLRDDAGEERQGRALEVRVADADTFLFAVRTLMYIVRCKVKCTVRCTSAWNHAMKTSASSSGVAFMDTMY